MIAFVGPIIASLHILCPKMNFETPGCIRAETCFMKKIDFSETQGILQYCASGFI